MLLIVSLLISSCNSSTENNDILIEYFSDSFLLNGEQVFTDQYGIATIEVVDTLIVLSTRQDTIFHVYKVDGTYVTGFGRKGNGPGEFAQPPFIDDIKYSNNEILMLIYDGSKFKVVNINMTRSILKKELQVENEFQLPYELRHPMIFIRYSSTANNYIGVFDDRYFKRLNEQNAIFIYNNLKNTYKTLELLNLEVQPYDALTEANLNRTNIGVSPDRSKVAFSKKFVPVIEVQDNKSFEKRRFILEQESFEGPFDLEVFVNGNYPIYTEYMFVSNDFIYLLYSGNNDDKSENPQKINVIDWKGNSEVQYSIPLDFKLSRITVDERNQVIYGLSWENDAVYKFDISGL